MQKDLAEVKIFQKLLRGLLFWNTLYNVYLVLSLWHYCKSSLGSSGECRTVTADRLD